MLGIPPCFLTPWAGGLNRRHLASTGIIQTALFYSEDFIPAIGMAPTWTSGQLWKQSWFFSSLWKQRSWTEEDKWRKEEYPCVSARRSKAPIPRGNNCLIETRPRVEARNGRERVRSMESPALRHTCLKLHIDDGRGAAVIFVKGTWLPTRFELFITDGLDAWICSATETEVEQRAELWDQHVSEYIAMAERHLGFQQPGSIYRFEDAGVGEKRLSWTFEKQGTRLEWRWKCQSSRNSKQVTANILDFLMDANTRLSEEVVSIRQSFERLKAEAEKCLAQSEKYCVEKKEFEDATYGKFVAVLNSKKTKLRQLRDRLSRYESTNRGPQGKDDSSDNAGTVDGSSGDEETEV